jgi:hypothetical protein
MTETRRRRKKRSREKSIRKSNNNNNNSSSFKNDFDDSIESDLEEIGDSLSTLHSQSNASKNRLETMNFATRIGLNVGNSKSISNRSKSTLSQQNNDFQNFDQKEKRSNGMIITDNNQMLPPPPKQQSSGSSGEKVSKRSTTIIANETPIRQSSNASHHHNNNNNNINNISSDFEIIEETPIKNQIENNMKRFSFV